jgi:phosphoserine phosphatase
MHGLFTIFTVVDLSTSALRVEEFKGMVDKLSDETGLDLAVEKYFPTPRSPEKSNILLILLGTDKPGVIASVSTSLAKYKSNIEFSQMVAREDVFLMELLIDVSKCSLPLDNLKSVLTSKMAEVGIETIIQAEDVFNKKKRVILFDYKASFISKATLNEIFEQTGISKSVVPETYPMDKPVRALGNAAQNLEALPVDVLEKIINSAKPTEGTMELLQTLRIMGYKIAISTTAFTPFADALKKKLAIDYAFGVNLPLDDDTQSYIGELAPQGMVDIEQNKVLEKIIEAESIARENVTIIKGTDGISTPGIRFDFDLEQILDFYNKRILNTESITGLIGAFGIPKL